jgi:hypothetical protein
MTDAFSTAAIETIWSSNFASAARLRGGPYTSCLSLGLPCGELDGGTFVERNDPKMPA